MVKASLLKMAAFLVPLAGLLYYGITEDLYRPLEVGEKAPHFSLPMITGGPLELSQFEGRVVVLNFWATWCPPCVEEMPSLQRLFQERIPALQDFVAKHEITLPIAKDPQRQVAVLYGTYKYPESYIIGPQGLVRKKFIGSINWDEPSIRDYLNSLAKKP